MFNAWRRRRVESVREETSISCWGAAVHLGKIYEEITSRTPGLCIENCTVDGETTVVLRVEDIWGCDRDALDETIDYIHSKFKVNIRAECTTTSAETCGSPREYLERIIRRVRTRYLRELLEHTSRYGREFFLLVTWNGSAVIGEGEEEKVSLPLIRGVVFAHTHPSGNCMPSHYDILSFQDFFGEGGLVEIIASSRCVLVAYTSALYEKDYWELQEIAECVRKAKTPDTYFKCINRLYTLESLAVETYII